MNLLIGSKNEDKVKEFKLLLEDFLPNNTQLSSLTSFPFIHDILEDGKSFLENAIIKAKTIFEYTKLSTLCDDSGLVIDALDGAPGIYSARYPYIIFGRNASMNETMHYILEKLHNTPQEKRSARFVCALAFINSHGKLFTAQGIIEGSIAYTIEGIHGFGYDPIFIPQGHTLPLSMLSKEEKNAISHRYTAVHTLFTQLDIKKDL